MSSSHIHVYYRDIGKAIVDCEYYLMYLNTLQPWFLRLNQAFSPDSIMKLFPPTIKTLLLVWQHSRYCIAGIGEFGKDCQLKNLPIWLMHACLWHQEFRSPNLILPIPTESQFIKFNAPHTSSVLQCTCRRVCFGRGRGEHTCSSPLNSFAFLSNFIFRILQYNV